ncbi:twin-arginine translocase subunit TatC [Thermicanus aegyptius]|uniref:twin-arginine translocase subunit TatC n=1 Tax=Thermicanus aegyptius TaxID=94009 RepID=UPI00034CBAF3|nr:twin-arginine translocase subunit TatC [Thermicanus aegyptius]
MNEIMGDEKHENMGKDPSEMSLVGHLTELRNRLIYVTIYFIISFILGFVVAQPVVKWLQPRDLENYAFGLADAVMVYMKIAFIISLVLTFPFLLYQIWAFVRPGLKKNEQAIALRFIPAATLLFVLGLGFGYFVLFPMMIQFMVSLSASLGITMMLGINQYFEFMFNILLPIAIIFEMPIVVMFLTRLRILNPLRLRKMRKIAYFILIIIAIVVTPADFVSDMIVTIPLILLYEISVWISSLVYKKQLQEDQEAESRWD